MTKPKQQPRRVRMAIADLREAQRDHEDRAKSFGLDAVLDTDNEARADTEREALESNAAACAYAKAIEVIESYYPADTTP